MANRVQWIALSIACLLTGASCATADDAPKPDLEPFVAELRKLVLKHYPKGQVVLQGQTIHFEFKTRKFLIHEPLLTGEWQDAQEQVGPQRGGIYGTLELCAGEYQGMAAVPQSFDKHYFTLLLMAPYSKKLDHHLNVRLKYPRDVPPEFLKEVERLVAGFDEQSRQGM